MNRTTFAFSAAALACVAIACGDSSEPVPPDDRQPFRPESGWTAVGSFHGHFRRSPATWGGVLAIDLQGDTVRALFREYSYGVTGSVEYFEGRSDGTVIPFHFGTCPANYCVPDRTFVRYYAGIPYVGEVYRRAPRDHVIAVGPPDEAASTAPFMQRVDELAVAYVSHCEFLDDAFLCVTFDEDLSANLNVLRMWRFDLTSGEEARQWRLRVDGVEVGTCPGARPDWMDGGPVLWIPPRCAHNSMLLKLRMGESGWEVEAEQRVPEGPSMLTVFREDDDRFIMTTDGQRFRVYRGDGERLELWAEGIIPRDDYNEPTFAFGNRTLFIGTAEPIGGGSVSFPFWRPSSRASIGPPCAARAAFVSIVGA